MRVGVDAGRALHGDGGVATYTRELVSGLLAHAPRLELVLFDLDRGWHRRAVFERVFGPLPAAAETARTVADALRGLDLFHAPGFVMPPAGAPHTVFTVHDLTVLSHPSCHTVANRARTLVSVAEALVRGATLLAVSDATRREAVRLLDLDTDRVEVVPPMVGRCFTAAASERDEAAVNGLGIDGPFVLAVAGLEPRKNLERLLDAWDLLPAKLRDEHSLVMVTAAGWLEANLRRRLARLTRTGKVIQIAGLSGFELAALYRRTRALVFPSLAEGFGLPVAEAMACGAPVVTSNLSSMPEVAGPAALLVDPEDTADIADGIERLLTLPELRRRLRERGPEQAARFTPETVVARLLEVYARAARHSRA